MLLLSIRPDFSQSILDGTKKVEFRRRVPRQVRSGSQLAIYETAPTSALVGLAKITAIVEATPATLWRQFKLVGGIERTDFDAYYDGAEMAVGIVLSDVRCFTHPPALRQLKARWGPFHPPQQFAYLNEDREKRVLRMKLSEPA